MAVDTPKMLIYSDKRSFKTLVRKEQMPQSVVLDLFNTNPNHHSKRIHFLSNMAGINAEAEKKKSSKQSRRKRDGEAKTRRKETKT